MIIRKMKNLIAQNRLRLKIDLNNSVKYWFFSPAIYSHFLTTVPLLHRFAHGKLIDLGCGDMPFKGFVIDQIDIYESLDIVPQSNEVTYIGDIQNLVMISDNSYDTVICLEVLEHVANPFQAISEIKRILKPEGNLILSVPHLSRLHDIPYDYYRFTQYGLNYLIEKAGLEVVEMKVCGGIFCFIGHQLSTILLGIVWKIPIIKNIIWLLNKYFITRLFYFFDRLFDKDALFALRYTIVAKKVMQ